MKKRTAAPKRVARSTRARSAARAARTDVTRRIDTRVIDLVPALMKLKSILVPVDFSPSSDKALTYALCFAEQFGARVTVLNVVEPAVYPTDLGYVPVEIDTLYRSEEHTS